jgi:hypothetical protein
MPRTNLKRYSETRNSLPNVQASEYLRKEHNVQNYLSTDALVESRTCRSQHILPQLSSLEQTQSTASLDFKQQHHHQFYQTSMQLSSHRYNSKMNERYKSHKHQNQRHQQLFKTFDFDSEPTYYQLQVIKYFKVILIIKYQKKIYFIFFGMIRSFYTAVIYPFLYISYLFLL